MKGKLDVNNQGKSMPITDPLYCPPPYIYRNCENMFIFFETDESAADFLPAELELLGEKPTAVFLLGDYGFSNLGSYKEFVFFLLASYEGKPYLYAPKLFLDADAPFAAGREIWGFPKKMATIGLEKEHDIVCGWIDRPSENRLLTMQISPSINLKQEDYAGYPVMGLKAIPSADGEGFDVLQLVEIPFDATPRLGTDGRTELWRGKGSISYGSQSNDDPFYKVPVVNVVDALFGTFDMYLPAGKVVHDYLA